MTLKRKRDWYWERGREGDRVDSVAVGDGCEKKKIYEKKRKPRWLARQFGCADFCEAAEFTLT